MKAMEGVRRVTNRMELVQNLRSKLLKARLSLIAVTLLLGVSAVTNIVMYNKLQDAEEVVAKQGAQITELENTIEDLENRCSNYCYKVRLEQTVKYAKENGYDAFTTTLLVILLISLLIRLLHL